MLEGNVFAEWNKVNLVVAAHPRAVRADHKSRVIVAPGTLIWREVGADIPHYQRGLSLAGDGYQRLLEAIVFFNERRGRFRPYCKTGMSGMWGTDNFAAGGACLGNPGNIGLALFAGKVGEPGHVAIPVRPHPRVFAGDIEIGLDQDGGCSSLRTRRRKEDTGGSSHGEYYACYAPYPLSKTTVQRKSGGNHCIYGHEQKADAVDAGPRRELINQRIVYL